MISKIVVSSLFCVSLALGNTFVPYPSLPQYQPPAFDGQYQFQPQFYPQYTPQYYPQYYQQFPYNNLQRHGPVVEFVHGLENIYDRSKSMGINSYIQGKGLAGEAVKTVENVVSSIVPNNPVAPVYETGKNMVKSGINLKEKLVMGGINTGEKVVKGIVHSFVPPNPAYQNPSLPNPLPVGPVPPNPLPVGPVPQNP